MTAVHATDSSDRLPRMEIFQATWAMMDLPGSEGSFKLQEAVDWVSAQGFAGIMHWAEAETDFDSVGIIRRAGLFAGIGFPVRDMATAAKIARAACDWRVSFLNAQVYDSFTEDADAVAKLEALYELCDGLGVPLFIETHRGMVTQDLLRSVAYAHRVPRARFTLDASHYVVAGEITQPDQALRFNDLLAQLIARTASIHARVSNGEQVQVDIGDGFSELTRPYLRWWIGAYQTWRQAAAPGEFFPFVCELGPRPYSVASPVDGSELSDRRSQALVFKKLGEFVRAGVDSSYGQ